MTHSLRIPDRDPGAAGGTAVRSAGGPGDAGDPAVRPDVIRVRGDARLAGDGARRRREELRAEADGRRAARAGAAA